MSNEELKKETEITILPTGGAIDDLLNGGDHINEPLPIAPPIGEEITLIKDEITAKQLAAEKADASEIFANPLEEPQGADELIVTDDTKAKTLLDKVHNWLFEADPMEDLPTC